MSKLKTLVDKLIRRKKADREESRKLPPARPHPAVRPLHRPLPALLPHQHHYRHIRLGAGGLLHFDPTDLTHPNSISFIGTSGCSNTVGVFFEVTDTLCFAAHIDAYLFSSTPPRPDLGERRVTKLYATNTATAQALRIEVIKRLDTLYREVGLANWPKNRKRITRTLVMTCRKLSGQGTLAQEVVAKAVRGWVDDESAGKAERVARTGGSFVVGWPGGEVREWEQGVGEEWVDVDSGMAEGEWSVGVQEAAMVGEEGLREPM
ncbi:hypothetical protein B0A48_06898 [Cryoendolithus antarcticus]|uniref:Uncharacterized protein n=1 Tax=Cryoendolithus antarcticus TaxID=1507870 RepID=A0A1V8T9Z9_9PEZI|nr:hypothetical protein B0A48_06898 [Cryoendolithus antarcticus]